MRDHCDPETLSLVALGETPSAQDADHLAGCPDCSAELESLRAVVGPVRAGLPRSAVPVEPPALVWQRIAAQTGIGAHTGLAEAPPLPAPPREAEALPAKAPDSPVGPMLPIRPRRSWRSTLAVAATALVVGGVGGSLITRAITDQPPPGQVISVTVLAPLSIAPSATGRAEVIQTSTGRVLDVDASQLSAAPGAFYEVWLIDRRVQRMVPVGILRGDRGDFTIPAGLDLGEYPVVDISVQPLNGDPRHSGKSVLRGTIQG